MAIQRAQRCKGEPVWSLKTSMSNMRMDRGPRRNDSIGLGKASGSNTTRFVPNAPTSTGGDGLVLCQFLILGWPYTKTLVLLDGITMATLIFKIDRALAFSTTNATHR